MFMVLLDNNRYCDIDKKKIHGLFWFLWGDEIFFLGMWLVAGIWQWRRIGCSTLNCTQFYQISTETDRLLFPWQPESALPTASQGLSSTLVPSESSPLLSSDLLFGLVLHFWCLSFPCFWAGVEDIQLKSSDDFVWAIETPVAGKIVIDVEFLDLKVNSPQVSMVFPSIFTGDSHNTFSFNHFNQLKWNVMIKVIVVCWWPLICSIQFNCVWWWSLVYNMFGGNQFNYVWKQRFNNSPFNRLQQFG